MLYLIQDRNRFFLLGRLPRPRPPSYRLRARWSKAASSVISPSGGCGFLFSKALDHQGTMPYIPGVGFCGFVGPGLVWPRRVKSGTGFSERRFRLHGTSQLQRATLTWKAKGSTLRVLVPVFFCCAPTVARRAPSGFESRLHVRSRCW
jgi:hypothetical protein